MKQYRAYRYSGSSFVQAVTIRGGTTLFSPLPTYSGRAPGGHDWGAVTQGSAYLAYDILMDSLGNAAADELSERFQEEVIAHLPSRKMGHDWTLTEDEVRAWAGLSADETETGKASMGARHSG
jgi:hypothetical protein